ncbi:MAG: dihydrodipicolinate synthase family protein [Deltaproteobacteria bacterium]|nr:dihydrodipicolinate synthase family protein [Deltaproteobacteria bacterium]
MTAKKRELSGVLTPMVTPFKDDRVLFHGLIDNVEKMNGTGLAGYFVLGTNGEYKSLSVAERFEVLRAVVKYRAKDKVVMAGMGFESTKETIDMVLRAADEGADMASLLMPHFFAKKMTAEVLAGYILAVADASPIPVLLYNNPSVAAAVTIKADLIDRVKDHPNVIGLKDSSTETYQQNLEAAKGKMCVLAGSANYFLDLLKRGGTGGVLSLANVFPDACAKLYILFKEGKTQEAEALNAELVGLNKEVSGSFGVAGVKAAMDLYGFCGGVPRRPLLPLTPEQLETLKASLGKSKFAAR